MQIVMVHETDSGSPRAADPPALQADVPCNKGFTFGVAAGCQQRSPIPAGFADCLEVSAIRGRPVGFQRQSILYIPVEIHPMPGWMESSENLVEQLIREAARVVRSEVTTESFTKV